MDAGWVDAGCVREAARPVEAMRVLDALPEVEKTSLFGTSVHAVVRDAGTAPEALARALRAAGVDAGSAAVVSPSLEDVFLDVVERVGAPA